MVISVFAEMTIFHRIFLMGMKDPNHIPDLEDTVRIIPRAPQRARPPFIFKRLSARWSE